MLKLNRIKALDKAEIHVGYVYILTTEDNWIQKGSHVLVTKECPLLSTCVHVQQVGSHKRECVKKADLKQGA
jgi:hypothetical protein